MGPVAREAGHNRPRAPLLRTPHHRADLGPRAQLHRRRHGRIDPRARHPPTHTHHLRRREPPDTAPRDRGPLDHHAAPRRPNRHRELASPGRIRPRHGPRPQQRTPSITASREANESRHCGDIGRAVLSLPARLSPAECFTQPRDLVLSVTIPELSRNDMPTAQPSRARLSVDILGRPPPR